ncbi:MAG: hypothetical protein C5B52_09780 [Bacteroidetes bacterium]|nr:MAG: hypothetical protein C5B52_09780 [Bacteroidota bacterium]
MKYIILIAVLSAFTFQEEPWKNEQLMAPATLAAKLNDASTPKPLIIDVGPAGLIANAVDLGPAHEQENLNKLKTLLEKENKDREVVIYCGCCPFKNCPNVRPAFTLLNTMKFTHAYLLNLPQNLKVDWIAKGYPMAK